MRHLSETDRARITAAIRAAEAGTSGQFVAVIAQQADHYRFAPIAWAGVIALLLPGAILLFGAALTEAHLYELQLAVFVGLIVVFLLIPRLHLALVPRHLKVRRAHRLAQAQFYERGVHRTQHHSGVLFFVSLAERYVEIVADHGIHERVGEAQWRAIIAAFLEPVRQGNIQAGFTAAISACGAAMAQHFPRDPGSHNELSDGPVEL